MGMNYQQMVDGCRRRNAKAQRALYDELAPMCVGVCHRYVADRDEAADMLQDGFVHIFENIGKLRNPEKLRSWAYTVMVNTCVSYLRRSRKLVVKESLGEVPDEAEGDDLSPYSMNDLRRALDSLTPWLRTAFNLCAVEGKSCAEAAEMMATKESNVRLLVFRARAALRRELETKKDEQ